MHKIEGKLIVVEGTDGSGKKTQVDKLYSFFNQNNISTQKVHFPRYDEFYGQLCARLLNGEFGDYQTVSPYFYTLMLAMDRWQAKPVIEDWLEEGRIVLSDRYVYSLAHQTARMPVEQREAFTNWYLKMEFEINELPREDLVIFLHVPTDFSVELVKQKEKRAHLNGKDTDIAEKDFDHQRKAEEVYLQFAQRFDNWKVIECIENNELRSIESIHAEILDLLYKENILL